MTHMMYDNYYIKDLDLVLTKDTITSRYYELIEHKTHIIEELKNMNILTKDDYLDSKLILTSIPEEVVSTFKKFLSAYRFRPFPLKKMTSLGTNCIKELNNMDILTTHDVLLNQNKLTNLDNRYHKVIAMSHLARVIGVRDVRASLYFDCGFERLTDLTKFNLDEFLAVVQAHLDKSRDGKILPLRKEAATTLAWARVFSRYDEKTRNNS